jgi:hypothetical protein
MYKIICILLLLGLFLPTAYPQVPDAYVLTATDVDSLHFYDALCKLKQHEQHYQSDKRQLSLFYQVWATIYTFNGMPDSAIIAMDKATMLFRKDTGTRQTWQAPDTVFEGYHPVSAQSHIVSEAANYRAIMINEAHTAPQHRVFTKSLLKDLYRQGYRALCLEAIKHGYAADQPPSWDQYNWLHRWKLGYYTKESNFAELIREADRIGYKIYGYEPQNARSNRDSMMAVNIQEVINQKHPHDKIIIYAGYGHISKTNSRSTYNYFKTLTDIDALTVNQTNFYEHSEAYGNDYDEESAYYDAFKRRFTTSEPVVLLDSSQRCFDYKKDMDVYVFSPPAAYRYGRPEWLFEQGARKAVALKKIRRPSIIKAYYANEVSINTRKYDIYQDLDVYHIPVDILTLETIKKDDRYYLALPEGIFLIQYRDLKGNMYKQYYYRVTHDSYN